GGGDGGGGGGGREGGNGFPFPFGRGRGSADDPTPPDSEGAFPRLDQLLAQGWDWHSATSILPTIDLRLKLTDVPSWSGERSELITYFALVQNFERQGGMIPLALTYALTQRFTLRARSWWLLLPEPEKSYGVRSWPNLRSLLRQHYLGANWVVEQQSLYDAMSFRQRGFGTESPTDYILRCMLAGRFLLENPSACDEVFKAMERTPPQWRTILGSDRMASVGELLPAVQDNEEDLLQAVRNTNLASDFEMLARRMDG
ncbi:hypothetical protein CALVIDRAFT_569384, partial [Calocera viscosa TUFC12733]